MIMFNMKTNLRIRDAQELLDIFLETLLAFFARLEGHDNASVAIVHTDVWLCQCLTEVRRSCGWRGSFG
jgi:hypothetical protein